MFCDREPYESAVLTVITLASHLNVPPAWKKGNAQKMRDCVSFSSM